MDRLDLDQILRYVLAGAMAILAATLAYCQPATWAKSVIAASPTVFVGIVLLIGSFVYVVVHRLVMYPIVRRISLLVFYKRDFYGAPPRGSLKRLSWLLRILFPYWITKKEREIEQNRWRRVKDQDATQLGLKEWASHIHYMYCASWAGFGSLYLGCLLGWDTRPNLSKVCYAALGFFICAMVQHARYTSIERQIEDEKQD